MSRKTTIPMDAEKRKKQLLTTALKLAHKGGRVTLAAIAAQHDVSAPLVANYLGRRAELEKTIRAAAKAQNVKIPDSFCVQGGSSVTKAKPAAKKVTTKQVKAIKAKAAPAAKAPRVPKPKVVPAAPVSAPKPRVPKPKVPGIAVPPATTAA